MPEDFPQTITSRTQEKFTIGESGIYAISITARCNGKNDLRVEIDNQFFRETPPKENIQKFDIPPAWNGTKLKGRSQTNIFLLQLDEGEHVIDFIPEGQAQVEEWTQWRIENPSNIIFSLNQQAENGNGRPWFTFILVDLPLVSITAEMSISWHLFDGDDVKLIIDNAIEKNTTSLLWKNWLWRAVPKQIFSGVRREKKTIVKILDKDIHHLEFWADKTPILHNIVLELGDFKLIWDSPELNNSPTVDDPKWTGNFEDDTTAMILARLIFGEARNQPQEAMIGVGWVIKNRVNASKKYFGSNYHEVILKNDGKYWQFSSFMPSDPNFRILIDPSSSGVKEVDKKVWLIAYDIASRVINDLVADPTDGATFFHSSDLSQEKFVTQSVPGAIFIKKIEDFLFYKDPNEN